MAFKANYDESKVPHYVLPEALTFADGAPVRDAAGWRRRREEILRLFQGHVYGRCPAGLPEGRVERTETDDRALSGLALRRQVRIALADGPAAPAMDLLIYLPQPAHGPVPVFLGMNFLGNHTVHADAGIRLPRGWVRNDKARGIDDHRARQSHRGIAADAWPVELILSRGYGLATVFYCDVEPDDADAVDLGIRSYCRAALRQAPFGPSTQGRGQGGEQCRTTGTGPEGDDSWGAIAAWAWGLSRALDYLRTDRDVDGSRVAVLGHSRLGKTALWAGATDERFAMAISNDSGCGGAALSRRKFGETVERINTSFPHWFCRNFRAYNAREEDCPVDQHMLVSLMAPRPVYVASAAEDLWADPKGEFLSALHAGPVYRLLGREGLPVREMPPLSQPTMGTIGYHIRPGQHAITEYDWRCYLDFADRHYGR